jgi:hypothetical protein
MNNNYGRPIEMIPGVWEEHEDGSRTRDVTPIYEALPGYNGLPFSIGQDNGNLLDLAEIKRDLLWSLLEEIKDPRLVAALQYPNVRSFASWRDVKEAGFGQDYLSLVGSHQEVPFTLRSFLKQHHDMSFTVEEGPLVPDVASLNIWQGHYLIERDFGPCCSYYTHEGEGILLKELEDPHDD